MVFKEFYNMQNKIGPRHLKNDGLLNTTKPETPIAKFNKTPKSDGTEEIKNNNKKISYLNNFEKIRELQKKHPYLKTLKPDEVKTLTGTNISVAINPKGGYVLINND